MNEIDNATFHKGIREDGTVEGYPVETYYRPCEGIGDDDGFLRVQIDDDATDIETRVPHCALIAAGWTKALHPVADENQWFGDMMILQMLADSENVNEQEREVLQRWILASQRPMESTVAAERERCAAILDDLANDPLCDSRAEYDEIAASIRKEPT
jgi:hypothetical protein